MSYFNSGAKNSLGIKASLDPCQQYLKEASKESRWSTSNSNTCKHKIPHSLKKDNTI